MVFVVEEALSVTGELVEAIGHLLPFLSSSAPTPGEEELEEIVRCKSTVLLVARDGAAGPIVGTLTLALFRIPTGVRAWIEDVIADEAVRGRGCGEALTREALRIASERGARTVELTSRPSREAANRLYRRIGFSQRETNVYRYEL